jgi:hypothetical protein
MQEEMERVEQDLRLLSHATIYPATPPLAQAVRRRLEGETRYKPQQASIWQLALMGIAATVVLAAAIAGSVTPARHAVADFFDRINIFETDEPLAGVPTEIPGTPVTLEEAATRLGFAIKLPEYPVGLRPERVLLQEFVVDFGPSKAVVMFFTHPNGTPFLLLETNERVGKGIPTDGTATARLVSDFGSEAYWIEGPHTVQYYDEQGDVIPESVRLTGENTLIFVSSDHVFRIEGDLSQEEVMKIAQSLR